MTTTNTDQQQQQQKELVKSELLQLKQLYKPLKVRSTPGKFPLEFTIVFRPSHSLSVDFEGVQIAFTIDEHYPIHSVPKIENVQSLKEQAPPLPHGLLQKIKNALNTHIAQQATKRQQQHTNNGTMMTMMMIELLEWFDQHCASLVMDMQYVEAYMAESADGSSCRRYAFKVGLIDTTAATNTPTSTKKSTATTTTTSTKALATKLAATSLTTSTSSSSTTKNSKATTHDDSDYSNSDEEHSEEEENSEEEDDDEDEAFNDLMMMSLMREPLALTIGSVSEDDVGLAFDYMDLQNISVMECIELSILVLCARCQKQLPVRNLGSSSPSSSSSGSSSSSTGGAVDSSSSSCCSYSSECDTCSKSFSVVFHPVALINLMMNQQGGGDEDDDGDDDDGGGERAILGKQWARIELSGCTFFDTLPDCRFRALCFECSTVNDIGVLRPRAHNTRTCRKCHKELDVVINGIRRQQLSDLAKRLSVLSQRSGGGGGKSLHHQQQQRQGKKKSSSSSSMNKLQGITEGCPLPNNGTCKHYRHSKRWLRFPCCGRAFPCDICHEEQTSDGMVYATRMLCGYCSREQSCADTCKYCQRKLTRKFIDPSVAKKRSAFKTVSRKSERSKK